jgi:hypothetical protein
LLVVDLTLLLQTTALAVVAEHLQQGQQEQV